MTYRELVYIVLDELKLMSDDASFTEDHIIFLCGKYRALLLKQKYSKVKKPMSESNYQTVCLDLIKVPAINGEPCTGGYYLRSNEKIPITLSIGNPRVYPIDFYQGDIAFISRDRMRYVGYNKWMKNIIYCSISPDGYLFFKSNNPQYLYLEKVKFTAVFEHPEKVSELTCSDNGDSECDILDRTFPIEEALVVPLIDLIVKELRESEYAPSDENNNANDDLDNVNIKK